MTADHPPRSPDSPDLRAAALAVVWEWVAGGRAGKQLSPMWGAMEELVLALAAPRSLDSVRTPRHSTIPQHTAIYADLDTIIQAAERATNLLHDAESDSVRTPDLDVLGLSDEQTRNLRKHLADRQQTLGEWIGDVLFDMRLGRPDGLEYPPASAALHPASPSDETPATGVEE
jgi:hypothetical protein